MIGSWINYVCSSFIGNREVLAKHKATLLLQSDINKGVRELLQRCGNTPDDAEVNNGPIFLFSAGWRSGSTLLQRLLMSDPNVFIWGEPYDHCGIVQALAETIEAFTPDWPPTRYFYDGSEPKELVGRWIADLYPPLEDLRRGHRAVFETMLAEPARQAGAMRWGFKEVRLEVDHAYYLKWLFPEARFVFIYRNPLEAYRSYCGQGRSWYAAWPNRPVFTATAYGRHWSKLVKGYIDRASDVNGLVVRYEDLKIDDDLIKLIESFLNVNINRDILDSKVGSSDRNGEKNWVSQLDKWLLRRAVSDTAQELGYDW